MTQLAHAEMREDLACAFRWAARLNLHEGVDNHFSAAVPGEDGDMRGDRFLINPYGLHWSEMTASALCLCDEEGKVLEGSETVENTAFYIHSRIHAKVPSARVVLHTHQPYSTAVTLLEGGRLEMCEQNALMFDDRIAYDDNYYGLALDNDEGDRLARAMGNRPIAFLASHGVIVSGATVADAFTDLFYLERAAQFQMIARATGGPLRTVPDEVRRSVRRQFAEERPRLAERHFSALKRILDREEPEYRL